MLQFFIFCHQTFKYPNENRQKQTKSMKLSKTVLPDTEDKERFGVEAGVMSIRGKGKLLLRKKQQTRR